MSYWNDCNKLAKTVADDESSFTFISINPTETAIVSSSSHIFAVKKECQDFRTSYFIMDIKDNNCGTRP